jgi:hypothetical protein
MSDLEPSNDDEYIPTMNEVMYAIVNGRRSWDQAGINAMLMTAWLLEAGWTRPNAGFETERRH